LTSWMIGEWVLVHAAAGGVGLAACQIAHGQSQNRTKSSQDWNVSAESRVVLGCKVIAAASSEEKRRICIEKGKADETIDYTKEGWQKEVMRITDGKGVNVVYDPVGGSSRSRGAMILD